ncbi:MAG: SDR family NAD(P)-dependent oxidoreductase [Dehalococcoidia bacterium]
MSLFELKGKSAIVTGGGTGIGKGIALELAGAGANVALASRKRENLEKVAAEIRDLGREALVIPTDICIPEQVDNMIEQTVGRFGRLDILVNNAGIGDALSGSKVEELPLDAWKATIELNLTGTFICCVAAAKVMIEQKSGKIVNISSCVGIDPFPRLSNYGAGKAGVINMTKSMAAEWAEHNINVNSISPGAIVTEKSHRNAARQAADGTPIPPLRLPGSPKDVGHLAVFLASEAASHITGETFEIKGANIRGY